MEKRIELEKRGRRPNQIAELNLDNCRSTNIVGLSDEFTALESLSLINVGLTTLKGFPKLPSLKKLELSDNRISNGLNYLTASTKLAYLNLSGNKIKDLETLKPLETFKNLAVLDLFNNEATTIENYREKIFSMLPSLKYLDGFDADDVEAPSDGEGDDEDMVNIVESDDEVDDEDGDDDDDDDDEEEEDEDEEEDDDDDESSDEEENGVVPLNEIYNNDLEEDDSDWGEEDAGANEPSNEGADKTSDGDKAVADGKEDVPEESQARGKKRKHDG